MKPLRRGARWLVLVAVLTLSLTATPNAAQAQNPTSCWGGWTEASDSDTTMWMLFMAGLWFGIGIGAL
jgi:hypothetical protein